MPLKQITGIVRNYDWGSDSNCLVYHLAKQGGHVLPEDTPESKFAELWLGTHPSGPAKELDNVNLPYLLKVLSIEKALSIQVHPDETKAQRLHQQFPDIYKDPDGKHEIAIALTRFELLAGLLSPTIVEKNLVDYPEIGQYKTMKDLLQHQDEIDLDRLIERLRTKTSPTPLDELILRLSAQFPQDNGILCPVYMGYHCLEKGDAIFLRTGIPHAYLSGEIIESMICSDNVVRAALTNKYKDMNTLFEIMTDEKPMIYYKKDQPSTTYNVENQFIISTHNVSGDDYELKIPVESILLIVKGCGNVDSLNVTEGQAFYISTETEVKIKSIETMNIVIVSTCPHEYS